MADMLMVREMRLEEVGIRVDYFHNSSDDYLKILGVERALLPSREDWLAFYEEDYLRPIQKRLNYLLVWEMEGQIVGFSSSDQISFGSSAFMHLHVLEPSNRRKGLGAEFVKKSARAYFNALQLEHLYCEPNAFNTAPNRTVQAAGFRYLFTHKAQPSPINYPQVTTRWVVDKDDLAE